MKQKSQKYIWRSKCTLSLEKIKFENKWNLKLPWRMEVVTPPSVGASFKKWGCCTPILPKCQEVPQKSPKKKINFFFQRTDDAGACVVVGRRPLIAGRTGPLTVGRRPVVACRPRCGPPFFYSYHHFFKPRPPSLGTCGQLFLIGSNTCPPYPYFT
jgi:hypothetical protein